MHFQQLPEDVLRYIFSFCDIYAVVSIGGTSKYFHCLSTDSLVWVDLVYNLRRRGFVDRLSLSDIQSYSQEDLMGLVKGLLLGPASLATVNSESQSLVAAPTRYTIHTSSTPTIAALLPGGEYILCYSFNAQTFECWSVQHGTLVWAYVKKNPASRLEGFGAKIIDGGVSANIIVGERDVSKPLGPIQFEIVNLDFATGTSTPLFVCEFPPVYRSIIPEIRGDIASVSCVAGVDQTCRLINWKTQMHLELAFSKTSPETQFAVKPVSSDIFVLCPPLFQRARNQHLRQFSTFLSLA
ncbi:F-box domain-containing protein [Mycena sanguinolenta]|uniref:F-box domain-containing protein n=1 Tax=Mycena sanguinolenta TaxID=230812 RepID=A0A8H6Y384_9AGAR|nr:F-box domain-containing protein [Mycena sanguinolenta]